MTMQKPMIDAILELSTIVAKLGHRVEALESQYKMPIVVPMAVPGYSLVEKVAGAIHPDSFSPGDSWGPEARAAIRAVAAWLRENDAECQMGGDAAATADLLDEEASQ